VGATAVLIRKELRQHWLPFGFLATLLALATTGMLVSQYFNGKSSSVFTGVRMLLSIALPASAMLICGRLVVAEYRSKTQLFLEALPLSRMRMIGVKYFFGLGALLLFVGALLATAGWMLGAHEAMTLRFAAILASRAAACAWFWHSLFFTTGLLGRYRWPLMVILLLVTFAVDSMSGWEIQRFGPFELLNHEFGAERQHFPLAALKSTLASAAGISLVGFLLALVREGNVSALMAERMSHREKVFVAVVILGSLAAIGIFDDQRTKKPYDLQGSAASEASGSTVKVAGPTEHAKDLANELAVEMGALREYLAIERMPTVLVTHRADLDATKYERGELAKAEGFVVRANYAAPGFDRRRFLAWMIPELLDFRSHGRTALEPRRWVRDGFGEFWVRRAHLAAPLSADREVALRALYATPDGFRITNLAQWYRVRENLGEGVAGGLAWSGLKTIASVRGKDACREFLRGLFSAETPKNLKATFHDKSHPWQSVLKERAGLDLTELEQAWSEALEAARHDLATPLAALPRLKLDVHQRAATDVTTLLGFQLSTAQAPAGEIEYRVRYLALPGLDEPFDEDDLVDEAARARLDAPVAGELAESFARGTRAVVGASLFLPELGCDVTSGWKRMNIGP
jgi:hypothetical protein